jgi:hypothetical protein
MRAMSDADVAAVRAAVNRVLAELPEDKLRRFILELMFSPFTMTTQHRRRGGRPRKHVDEETIVPLPRKTRGRRRKGAVDAAKLAERRKRYAANRRAARQAARAAKAIKAASPAGNGQDTTGNGANAVTAENFWKHAQIFNPQAPWKRVASEFGVNENAARHAFRTSGLPSGVGPVAIEKFLGLQA